MTQRSWLLGCCEKYFYKAHSSILLLMDKWCRCYNDNIPVKLLQYHFWFNCHDCTSWKNNCNVNCLICSSWYYILYALTAAHDKMVNKCLVDGCNSGCSSKKHQDVLGFFFFNKPDLLTKWIKFDNRSEWKPIKNSIVCIKYFKDDVIKNGKRMK